jgi:RimJ/RimL family protein N-acetyltransferase
MTPPASAGGGSAGSQGPGGPPSPLLRRGGRSSRGRPWLIRPTRADEDAAELVAIRDEVAAEGEYMAAVPGERTVLEETLALSGLLSGGGLALTVEIDGRIVGALMVERRRGPYERHRGDLSISIRPGYRGEGLGRALVDTAVDWARAVGLRKLTLGVFPGNVVAMALYRAVGFVEEGTLRAHLHVGTEDRDLVVMGLLL